MFIILCKCLRMSMSRFLSKLIWAIVCDKVYRSSVYRSCPDRVNMLGSISFTLGRQPLQTFVPLLNFVNANCCLGRKPLSLLFVWWIPWVCLVDHNDSPQLRSVALIGDCDPRRNMRVLKLWLGTCGTLNLLAFATWAAKIFAGTMRVCLKIVYP